METISEHDARMGAAGVLDAAVFWKTMQDKAVISRFVDGAPLEGYRGAAVEAAQRQCDATQAILERQTLALRVLQGSIGIERMA